MTSLSPCGWLLPRPAQGFSSESMSPQQVRFGKTLSANLVASPTPTSNGLTTGPILLPWKWYKGRSCYAPAQVNLQALSTSSYWFLPGSFFPCSPRSSRSRPGS